MRGSPRIADEDHAVTGYAANVLFDDWDEVWAAADRLLARAAQVAGGDGLRCPVSYRIIGGLAVFSPERQAYGNSLGDDECAAESAILVRLQAVGRQ